SSVSACVSTRRIPGSRLGLELCPRRAICAKALEVTIHGAEQSLLLLPLDETVQQLWR
ncbi:MAG: hypothetical protein QOG30_172, partial [Acidimicrobiaceae bacterium]